MKIDLDDIDPAIRGIILELNLLGYKTMASCAGHSNESPPEGEILFARLYSHKEIRKILKPFELNILNIRDIRNPWFPKPRTLVTFKPLEGTSIGVLISLPYPMKLPSKVNAFGYFTRQGVDPSETEWLAKSMGYVEQYSQSGQKGEGEKAK